MLFGAAPRVSFLLETTQLCPFPAPFPPHTPAIEKDIAAKLSNRDWWMVLQCPVWDPKGSLGSELPQNNLFVGFNWIAPLSLTTEKDVIWYIEASL